jgi:hypothetical protein
VVRADEARREPPTNSSKVTLQVFPKVIRQQLPTVIA